MKRLLGKLFNTAARARTLAAEPPVGFERLHHMLEYARRRNLCGRGTSAHSEHWIGRFIQIVSEQRNFTAGPGNPVCTPGTVLTQYRSVSWSYMPDHLGVYLVDGKLEFRASHDGIGPRETMPLAIDPADLAEIKRCFEYWYEEFGLPGSLDYPVNSSKPVEPSGNALRDILIYLKDGSVVVFHELFENENPVIWIDWGEEDDQIVKMAARVLGLDDLAACFDNDTGDLLIAYRGAEHRVRYPEKGAADRDTTIIALNRLLLPEHELRLCNASRGSDTLALIALRAADWAALERKYPDACAEHFAEINEATVVFGKSD